VLASYLIASSAAVILVLGSVHLLYTYFGPKLLPRDPELRKSMESVSPVISSETTMWKAWVGFNASHSLGAILFGLVYGYLSLAHGPMLMSSWFLLSVGLATLGVLVVLGRLYWFRVPLIGISLAAMLFVAGLIAGQV
jgi:hypothetical protein